MSKVIAFIKKYPRSILITAACFLAVGLSIFGFHWSDLANNPFTWTLWEVVGVLSILACIGGFIYLSSRTKGRD